MLITSLWLGAVVAVPVYDSVNIRISYSGGWFGSYTSGGSMQTIQGTGNTVIRVNRTGTGVWVVSVMLTKQEANSDPLTVSIETLDGTVLETASTTAELGMASVTWTDATAPPIPGFPLAAIVLGFLSAFGIGLEIRARRNNSR